MPSTDQTSIIRRIRFLIDRMNISQAAFARRIGLDPANMSKHLNGKLPVTDGLVNRIAADLAVSKSWLATGNGVPFSKETAAGSGYSLPVLDKGAVECRPSDSGIPVYDIDVTAGARELSRELTDDRIIGSINIPDMRPGCMIVRVFGNSMTPAIADGAYIAIRPVSDLSCIFWGQIYVIVLDDFRLVKYVRRNPDRSMVTLRSDNPDYDDMEIPRSKIRRLYIVESILNLKLQC